MNHELDLHALCICGHLDEGLNPETSLTLKVGKVPHLLSEYTEPISIHNRAGVCFILENVVKK
jgi:hypothetical protein